MKTAQAIAKFVVDLERQRSPISEEDAAEAMNWVSTNIQAKYGDPVMPNQGESVAVSLEAPKTAALYFDRIWWMPIHHEQPPPGVCVYGASEFEMWVQVLLSGSLQGVFSEAELPQLLRATPLRLAPDRKKLPVERTIADAMFETRQIVATPVLTSTEMVNEQYRPGRLEIVVAAIDALQIVDEEQLTWEQVTEVRRDVGARRKYRRLIHWFDAEMIGKPASFITDELADRLDDYDAVIRKHGLKTVLGSLSSLLDPRFLSAATAVTAGAAVAGGSAWAAASAALLAAFQSGISVTSNLLDLSDIRRTTAPEVAYVLEHRRQRSATKSSAP
jgi:hypothetical protein